MSVKVARRMHEDGYQQHQLALHAISYDDWATVILTLIQPPAVVKLNPGLCPYYDKT